MEQRTTESLSVEPTRAGQREGGLHSASGGAEWLLLLGAALGLGLAAWGLLIEPEPSAALPRDAIAVVNGVAISRSDYARALEALATDRRASIGPDEERHVLGRLVDEELLVQRGIELGLMRLDRGLRAKLVGSVIQSVISDVELTEASDDELRAFYEDNAGFFTSTDRVSVERVQVRSGNLRSQAEARLRADAAAKALEEDNPVEIVAKEWGDPEVAPVPRGLLPVSKLREYLGPTLTQRALVLDSGEVSEPLADGSGYSVIRMVHRTRGEAPPFEQVRDRVSSEYRRRAGDRALRSYLDRLRDEALLIEVEELR